MDVDIDAEIEQEDDESFQNELRRAIEESKRPKVQPQVIDVDDAPVVPTPPPWLSERAAMEKERMERQKRRRAEAGLDPIEDEGRETTKKSRTVSPDHTRVAGPSTKPQPQEDVFWEGAHRPTANAYAHPREDGKPVFRLTDIIGPASVQVSFFSRS